MDQQADVCKSHSNTKVTWLQDEPHKSIIHYGEGDKG